MIAVPAIDLRDGACVQLVGGSFSDERVRVANPLDAVARWLDAGFTRLHVVDLDAATGNGSNSRTIETIIEAAPDARVSVGGGIRSSEALAQWLNAGADRVVVGTRALNESEWLAEISTCHPGRVVLAADVRDRIVVTHGWSRSSKVTVTDLLTNLASIPLGGVLVTAVHREGLLGGPDLPLVEEVARVSRHDVIASGGIATIDDLRALRDRGAAACVIGMALYTGALDPRAVAEEFGDDDNRS